MTLNVKGYAAFAAQEEAGTGAVANVWRLFGQDVGLGGLGVSESAGRGSHVNLGSRSKSVTNII